MTKPVKIVLGLVAAFVVYKKFFETTAPSETFLPLGEQEDGSAGIELSVGEPERVS